MKFEMSEENSKRVLSGTKWIANVGQSYLASLNNTTSSGKKLINAFLLVPIIVHCYDSVIFWFYYAIFKCCKCSKR